MDKLNSYRKILIKIVEKYGDIHPANMPGVKSLSIVDSRKDQYLVYHIGWHKSERVYDCGLHFEIIDNKVLVQQNTTNLELNEVLQTEGILEEDIILGFIEPMEDKILSNKKVI